jgi:hypothetical protein
VKTQKDLAEEVSKSLRRVLGRNLHAFGIQAMRSIVNPDGSGGGVPRYP